MRILSIVTVLLVAVVGFAQDKKNAKGKNVPTVDGKEIAIPEKLSNQSYQAWVTGLAKKYNGKTVRLEGIVEVVVEEPQKYRIQVPLRVKFSDDSGKEQTVRLVALFPFTKDAEIKKYTPTDMGRKK